VTPSSGPKLFGIIDYPDAYVQPLILSALKYEFSDLPFEFISSIKQLPSPDSPLLQFMSYESLDFEHALRHPKSSLICAYVIRKALIRKHYLTNTISTWLVKNPASALRNHFKAAANFELDYAEFLDEALVDAWDLNESMARNEALRDKDEKKEWWILKPGMSDGGNGIRLFCSMQQLRRIFEEWDEDEDGKQQEEEDDVQSLEESTDNAAASPNGVMTSQLRHFISQPYIDPPLLLPTRGNRKFHVRVYAVAVGALKVYVYKEMLALFAAKTYRSLSNLQDGAEVELASHLTNTCSQDSATREASVVRFWDLEDAAAKSNWKEKICEQICEVTGEVFEAAAREQMVHFQALPNAFEVFGVDFLVDAAYNVWLLELNAYPDFKQTGEHLQNVVAGRLFREVMRTAIRLFFNPEEGIDQQTGGEMLLVRDIDMGRR
jgi:tubulin---tyrosine ligase